ncbi:MAG TPA: CCA tRNA nucleotidyltransferase [Candidatus Nanoarchaeia archaeon]|nr:CCA tRNA nucleotidyltransferase [Candidatus Nanoarchaeia archaeon]
MQKDSSKKNSAKFDLKLVLQKIKPGKDEQKKFSTATASFLKSLNAALGKDGTAILGGSGAKGTWLSGNHDVDVFVLFDYKKYVDRSAELSALLEAALQKAFPKISIERLHGSRDYFQLWYQGLMFEIVPIIKISKAEQARNITDISPLHSAWVNKNAAKIKDEIRLLKQFCKANNLYGAESYIGGFSGYVLEILTAQYGSFEKVLKATQRWKEKDVVDPSKFYPTKELALFHINTSKLQSPLIVVDPVDKSRNAAAALSMEKFLLFKETAKKYLHKPAAEYFVKEKITVASLREKYKGKGTLLLVTVTPTEGKEDAVGAKLLKVFELLRGRLQKFELLQSGWTWNRGEDALFYFVAKKKELPEFEIHDGPPLKLKEFVEDFKRKKKNTFIEGGRIKAKVKVEHPQLKDFANELLKDAYVKEKVKGIKKMDVV